jgi:hypothetical protein
MEEEPLFNTNTGNEAMNEIPLSQAEKISELVSWQAQNYLSRACFVSGHDFTGVPIDRASSMG